MVESHRWFEGHLSFDLFGCSFPPLFNFFWHLTLGVTTVNVATTTDKYLLCLTCFCFWRFFCAVFIAPIALILYRYAFLRSSFHMIIRTPSYWTLSSFFMITTLLSALCYSIWVTWAFPSLDPLVALSFSILPTLWNLFLVTFISPFHHCHHWLLILGFSICL